MQKHTGRSRELSSLRPFASGIGRHLPCSRLRLLIHAGGLLGVSLTLLAAGPAKQRPPERPDDPPAPVRAHKSGPAAQPRVDYFSSVQVNVDSQGNNVLDDAANEPSIAVDPTQPNRVAIGWRQFDSIFSNFRQAGYSSSTDGGRTWSTRRVLTPGVFRSDPVLSYSAEGIFYYSSLESSDGLLTTDLFVSTNGGGSWIGPYYSYGGDKQWIHVDRKGGMGHGHVYQAWSTAAGCCGNFTFNRSTNGGFTFEYPVPVPSTPIWGTMDVDSAGTLWLVGVSPSNLGRFLLSRSSNAQNPAAFLFFDDTRVLDMGGPIVVQAGPNPMGLLGQAWLAIDSSSGPRAGWMYVVCSVDPPGADPLDVHFIRSTDGGQTWSQPVRLNDDQTNGWQWMATMSVAPNGRIDVIWNDTRDSGFANLSSLYYTSSSDGGTTWSPNLVLSPEWDSYLGWPNQEKIGDYYHMISDDVGAHLAWAATFNLEQDVYYLRIGDYDCNMNGIGDALDIAQHTSHDYNTNGIPDECEGIDTSDLATAAPRYALRQNTPNPFNPRTLITFEAPETSAALRLRVFDLRGHLVRTLFEGNPSGGTQSVWWSGIDAQGRPVASGLYVYRLEATGFVTSRKMVLLR